MRFLFKKSTTVLFLYFVFCLNYLLLISSDHELMTKTFLILRDMGNLIGAILIIVLVYSFSVNKNNEEKFILLKQIYKIILILILISFSKTIVSIFLDGTEIILMVLFSNNEGFINEIIKSLNYI